jgi:hypothetical protein
MKPLSDAVQILLSMQGAFGFAACCLLAWCLIQASALLSMLAKVVRLSWGFIRRFIVLPIGRRVFYILALASILFVCRLPLADALQYAEFVFIPAYEVSDTSSYAVSVYENELRKKVRPDEAEIVIRRTREISAKTGSTPLAIYEVAHSECGLDPFCIRTDGVAAGWIQFTTVGLTGLGYNLAQVKQACRERNTAFIMDLTEKYLMDRAKGKALSDALQVYLCVFAPAFIGADENAVLYQGWNNPAYYLNSGFDGYYSQNGRIFRAHSVKDGRIKINEIKMHLAAKKSRLLQKA